MLLCENSGPPRRLLPSLALFAGQRIVRNIFLKLIAGPRVGAL
jgi:hypothetical protein